MAVWGKNTRLSREVLFMRRSVMDGMRWSGTKMVCRMSWSTDELDDGKVQRCPHCWDDVLKQVSNTRCKHCNGTGFLNNDGVAGGYAEPFVVWCSIAENSPMDNRNENSGMRTEQNVRLTLPCEPIFKDGDIFAEIREHDGRVTGLGRIFQLDGPVERQTVQGWVSNVDFDDVRSSRVEDMIISQRGTAKMLLPTDSIYEQGLGFWGFAEPDAEMIKQGNEPTVDLDSEDPGFADPYDWWN